eukprot:PLAT9792.1.p1 GENE.PLAT9792.1~~PLAT9792.1.p1  ORF type:complete len:347 (-),score=120.03 PLAT9792.1:88-1128(-)
MQSYLAAALAAFLLYGWMQGWAASNAFLCLALVSSPLLLRALQRLLLRLESNGGSSSGSPAATSIAALSRAESTTRAYDERSHTAAPYCCIAIRGRRSYMEDRFAAVGSYAGDADSSFFAVYDGHGGAEAATYCSKRLHAVLEEQLALSKDAKSAFRAAYLQTNEEYLEFADKNSCDDGTTAVSALVSESDIMVGNAGDSRAVLVQEGGVAVGMSDDHKPDRADEKRRILSLGGSVEFWGVWRVNGVLAVSRAIGDRMLRRFIVPEPEVKVVKRSPKDRYLVLASDGLWDVIENDEVALVMNREATPREGAEKLIQIAWHRGSGDNITVLVVDLGSRRKPRLPHEE